MAGQEGHLDEEISGLLDENVWEWCIRQLKGRFTPPQRVHRTVALLVSDDTANAIYRITYPGVTSPSG